MRSDRKRTILFIIILLVMSMGMGYAFLTTTLTIDGVSDIDSASWDIHWENIEEISGSIHKVQIISPATISANGTSINYHIKLNEPGALYVFTFDEVNSGTLPGRIDDIIFKVNNVETNLPNYLKYDFLYVVDDEDRPISIGDFLLPGQSRKMVFSIEYDKSVTSNNLPTENQSIDFSIEIIYVQAQKGNYLYSVNQNIAHLFQGQPVPNDIVTYSNYQSAINALGNNFFIRLQNYDNVPTFYSVGFTYNDNVYYLDGADDGLAYEQNKDLLLNLFGSEKCYYNDFDRYYNCDDDNNDRTYRVYKSGKVSVGLTSRNFNCYINKDDFIDTFGCGAIII